jgi:hypothetical protein
MRQDMVECENVIHPPPNICITTSWEVSIEPMSIEKRGLV